jgi:hypothetical protein
VRNRGSFGSEFWFSVLMHVVVHNACVSIVFNVRFMESCDAMCPRVGIPYSRWCNLGSVILYPRDMVFDGRMIFVGLLIGFNLTPNWAL